MKITSRSGIVLMLTGLNLLNYLDRYVVNAVIPRIKSEFTLDYTWTGVVISAFMLGYFVTSPIFGALGDRYPRKGLIAFGVAVWSVATIASGLAAGLYTLIAARIVVGIGEASYATLSPTIIDDLTDQRSKNRWLAVFYAAIPVGSALGFVAGGWLEHKWGWRSAFFVAGAPGLVLAVVVLLMQEPVRKAGAEKVKGAFARLAKLPLYRSTVLGYTAYTFALGAFASWAPTFLESFHKMELHTADRWLGITLAATGFAGTAIGGYFGDKFPGEDRTRAYLKLCGIVSAMAVIPAFACLLLPTAGGFFAAFALTSLLLFTATAPTNAAILKSVPDELRASAMAISIFMIHLFGDLVSPTLVGIAADLFGGSLRAGMLTLPVAIGIGAALWWMGAMTRSQPAIARGAAS